ncbi:hypothetical protein BJ742DRAFT_842692 [Cladochytrium replicatum]|nr:hypothetical protein BJ742DRAFT_842692 [Cladochytrium replicatum]
MLAPFYYALPAKEGNAWICQCVVFNRTFMSAELPSDHQSREDAAKKAYEWLVAEEQRRLQNLKKGKARNGSHHTDSNDSAERENLVEPEGSDDPRRVSVKEEKSLHTQSQPKEEKSGDTQSQPTVFTSVMPLNLPRFADSPKVDLQNEDPTTDLSLDFNESGASVGDLRGYHPGPTSTAPSVANVSSAKGTLKSEKHLNNEELGEEVPRKKSRLDEPTIMDWELDIKEAKFPPSSSGHNKADSDASQNRTTSKSEFPNRTATNTTVLNRTPSHSQRKFRSELKLLIAQMRTSNTNYGNPSYKITAKITNQPDGNSTRKLHATVEVGNRKWNPDSWSDTYNGALQEAAMIACEELRRELSDHGSNVEE